MHLERINNLLHELLFFKRVNTDVKNNSFKVLLNRPRRSCCNRCKKNHFRVPSGSTLQPSWYLHWTRGDHPPHSSGSTQLLFQARAFQVTSTSKQMTRSGQVLIQPIFLAVEKWTAHPFKRRRCLSPHGSACCPSACCGHICLFFPVPCLPGLQQLLLSVTKSSKSQLCPKISLYSSGTRSGSTGLGKKWVNFWCRLDLVPSLGVPSLFKATK